MPRLTFDYDKLLMCGPLTNRRITHYTKLGFYGKDAQSKALERDKKRDKIHTARQSLADRLNIYDL